MTQPVWVTDNFSLSNDSSWSFEEKEGTYPVFIIDTEGLGAMDEDSNHDTKIFLFAILLSSLLIYNSVGSIDETALTNLSLVVNLSKSFQVKNSAKDNDPDEMAKYFPSLIWVL